tara:strand:- start:40 stop:732 length:693 start_codon:yes stop_codon:yes gene_type:complete
MADITTSTNDGWIFKSSTVSWSDVRDASTGSSSGRTSTNNFRGVASEHASGRFGATFTIVRSFFEFDTSGISSTPTDATLKIYGRSTFGTTGNVIVVKGSQDGTLSTNDFDALDFSTAYSAQVTSWSSSGYNNITLNSTALGDIASESTFKVALINYDFDYSDSAPSLGTVRRNGVRYNEDTTAGSDPILSVTEAAAAGYGHKVFGVAAGSIGKINGVATANVGKVNTVD